MDEYIRSRTEPTPKFEVSTYTRIEPAEGAFKVRQCIELAWLSDTMEADFVFYIKQSCLRWQEELRDR